MITIAGASAGAGLAEAAVLALVAYIATTMSMVNELSAVDVGPITLRGGTPVLLMAAGILAIVRLLLKIVVTRVPAQLSGAVQSQLREQLFESFLAAAWPEKAKEKEGQLQELMGGQTLQAGNAVLHLANGFSHLLMLLTLAASAFVLSTGVAATVMATAVVLFAGLSPLSRQVRRRAATTSAASVAQASGVAESVRMAEEIQVFGVAEAERSRVKSLVGSLRESFVRTRTLSAIVPVLYQSAVIFLLVAGLALLYAIGTSQLAALGAVVLLLVRASAYGQQFLIAYQGLGESLPYLDRVGDAVEQYQMRAAPIGHRPINSIQTIDFDSVSFAYKSGIPILQNVSFAIHAGEAIGVVGPSGAGKSTLVQLLLRLREPTTGCYRVNGIPVSEIHDELWHRKVAYLPQEPHLLNATIADNIRFARDWITDDAIHRAAQLTHIHNEVTAWEDGYQTIAGQRNNAISGGQRQRLCLARALAGEPELLVLDEPTSSLDSLSERLIQESLKDLRRTLTIVVVAHRLSTLALCDRVMVIRDGHLEAFAPVELLYDSNDFYRHSVDLAASGGLSST